MRIVYRKCFDEIEFWQLVVQSGKGRKFEELGTWPKFGYGMTVVRILKRLNLKVEIWTDDIAKTKPKKTVIPPSSQGA